MTPIPTTDHDANLPAHHVGEVAHLARVLIDSHHWAMMPPGDRIAVYLVGEGASDDPV